MPVHLSMSTLSRRAHVNFALPFAYLILAQWMNIKLVGGGSVLILETLYKFLFYFSKKPKKKKKHNSPRERATNGENCAPSAI